MLFTIKPPRSGVWASPAGRAYLVRDNWNDWFTFETLFSLVVFDADGNRHALGPVKIGQFGMTRGAPEIPDSFDRLDQSFFSLGQDENYYEAMNQLGEGLRLEILGALRDVAYDLTLFEQARDEAVMENSLLRYVPRDKVRHRLHGLATGNAKLTEFKFSYTFAPSGNASSPPTTLTFDVVPESLPPTNIHILIGRNGVGKTRCLNNMTLCLSQERDDPALPVGAFSWPNAEDQRGLFANLVSVTFSAFDPFGPIKDSHGIRYSYVGLRAEAGPQGHSQKLPNKTLMELTDDFVSSVGECRSRTRRDRWRQALQTLEADPLFKEIDVASLSSDEGTTWTERAKKLYERLSSGHKIVLLTITRLIQVVDERTLVLIDEPEAHLHPPLLSAFVRALSSLLIQRNGVALIATHSPVVLQEAPKTCVWILRRAGVEVRAERPLTETFGENVGILTREVFGLEVTHAGFHKILEEAIAEAHGSYDVLLARFSGQLGAEARAIARGLLSASNPPPDTAP